jgi:putative transposase
MARRILEPVELTERQRGILEHLVRKPSTPQQVVCRARVILAAATGAPNVQVAAQLRVHRNIAAKWRTRWLQADDALRAAEAASDVKLLRRLIRELLQDRPRRGAPVKFSAEQVCQILAVACEKPEECGRPISHWTPRELADEAIKRRIVAAISPRTVGRFLKSSGPEATPMSQLAAAAAGRPGAVCARGAAGV